ncbi:unnamed protein product [Ectocarpus sp. CCAP 1310/34]|nr:unnamed protein product [Ectocarpus sp. CCAP 1310/34]
MRRIFGLLLILLISMGRRRVDAQQAQKACEAVRGGMSVRKAAKVYSMILIGFRSNGASMERWPWMQK